MKSRQVILELQSNRLDVVQYENGRCAKSRRISVDLDSDPVKWIEGVGALEERLSSIVEELGLAGRPVVVIYSSPTQVVDLVSTEVKSASDACDAAQLHCIDSMPFSSLTAVCDSTCVGRDGDRVRRKLHALAAADREDILTAIADLVEQSGLHFMYAMPVSASILRSMAIQSIRGKDRGLGHLFIGERQSYFLISEGGRIIFSRLINIGLDALVRSLTRPIRSESGEPAIELDLESARVILHACGIPGEPVIVDENRGLSSRQIMPLLQPMLQRLLVELRQSLRFGLTEEQRKNIKICVTGPGCSLNGIVEYLEDTLDIKTSVDMSDAGYDYRIPGAGGSEFLIVVRDLEKHPPIQLLPESHAKAGRLSKLRQWMWAGAAAAVLMIGLDGIGYQIRIDGLNRRLESVEGLSHQFEQLQNNGKELRASLIALNALERCVQNEMGTGADYRSALQELTRITPGDVKFMKIAFHIDDHDSRLSLNGFAFDPESPDGGRQLKFFMDSLQQSPLFDQAQLINVQSGELDERTGQRFDIGCKLIHTALPDRTNRLATAEGSGAS